MELFIKLCNYCKEKTIIRGEKKKQLLEVKTITIIATQ